MKITKDSILPLLFSNLFILIALTLTYCGCTLNNFNQSIDKNYTKYPKVAEGRLVSIPNCYDFDRYFIEGYEVDTSITLLCLKGTLTYPKFLSEDCTYELYKCLSLIHI